MTFLVMDISLVFNLFGIFVYFCDFIPVLTLQVFDFFYIWKKLII